MRNKKRGYLYILKSHDGNILKFGASSDPDRRLKQINRINKDFNFNIEYRLFSNDVFGDENKLRWKLNDLKCYSGTEYVLSENISLDALINHASIIVKKIGA